MRIRHRLVWSEHELPRRVLEPGLRRLTKSLGDGCLELSVDEAGAEWPAYRRLRRSLPSPLELVHTEFSTDELGATPWLKLSLTPQSYPEPSSSHGWWAQTFASTGCPVCGVGRQQIAPFRVRRGLRLRRDEAASLHWVPDALIVSEPVWSRVFAGRRSVGQRQVLGPFAKPLDGVVQVVIREVVPVDVRGLGRAGRTCRRCGVRKFYPPTRGPFPPLLRAPRAAIALSDCWLGDGLEAYRAILVGGRIKAAILDRPLRGVRLECVADRASD